MAWSDSAAYPDEWSGAYVEGDLLQEEPKEPIGIVAWAAALLLLITGLYARQLGSGWIPQMASIGLAVVWLCVDVAAKRKPLRLYPPIIFWFAWIAWGWIVDLLGTGSSSQLPSEVLIGAFKSTVKVYLIVVVMANIVRNQRNLMPIYLSLAVFASMMLILFREDVSTLSNEISRGVEQGMARLGSDEITGFGDANANSIIASFGLISAMGLFLLWKGKLIRWLALATMLPTFLFLGFLGSRTGLAMLPVLAIMFWFLYIRREVKGNLVLQMAGIAALVVMIGGLVIWIATSPFAFRFIGAGDKYKTGRGAAVITAIKMTTASPIIGHGTFAFLLEAHKFGFPPGHVVHNTPAEVLVRGGIPGFLLHYGAWFLLIRTLWRLRKLPLSRPDKIAVDMALLMCASYQGFSLTLTLINPRVQLFTIGACIGYAYGLREKISVDQMQNAYTEQQAQPLPHVDPA